MAGKKIKVITLPEFDKSYLHNTFLKKTFGPPILMQPEY